MKSFVTIWLWLSLLPAAAIAETLRIATYNVENYGPANRMTEGGYRQDYPKPEAEKRALRQVIRGMNADVLVLQEMGGQPYLDELRRDLKAEGLDYPHAALASAADADRHLAMLSRRPLTAVTTHVDLEFKYFGTTERVKRGLLEATMATDAGAVTLFVLHLKSRFTERPDDPLSAIRRAAEATAIRDCVLRRFPVPADARFLILGDCNDNRASRAAAFLQKRGKTEISTLLPAADSRGDNLNYWEFGDYLGIGAGAHSKLSFPHRVLRQTRFRDPATYIKQALAGQCVSSDEEVARSELPFEFMLNTTRLKEGFELERFSERTGLPRSALQAALALAEIRGLIARDLNRAWPTERGFDFLNDLQALFLP